MSDTLKQKTLELLQQALNANRALKEKCQRMQKAIQKENLEKVFWQRKCRYYAPNRMQEHYAELDEALKVANLHVAPPKETDKNTENEE